MQTQQRSAGRRRRDRCEAATSIKRPDVGRRPAVGAAVAVSLLASAATSPAWAITINGQFSDWTSAQLIGTDAAGDAGGGMVDYRSVWTKFENAALFISYSTQTNIDFAGNAWRYAGYLDTDSRTTTGYRGADGAYAIGADYLIEGATVYRYTGSGMDWAWVPAGTATFAVAGIRLEMRIPASTLGITSANRLKVMLVGNNDGFTNASNDFVRDDKAGFAFPRDPVLLDGSFTDWSGVAALGSDATGDIGASDPVDWVDLRAKSQNGTLYLSYTSAKAVDFANNASRYGVLLDTDNHTRTGYSDEDGGAGAGYLIEGGTLYRFAGMPWSWNPVGRVSVAAAGNKLELAVAEQHLGLTTPYRIRLRLRANNPTAADYAPDLNVAPGFAFSSNGQQAPVTCQRLATPSYFRSDALWTQQISQVSQAKVMLLNPINGPGEAVDPQMRDNVARARAAGMKVFGYVSTEFSGRDPVLVKADIAKYHQWYDLDGIFLDEVSVFCSVVGYYAELDRYIRSFWNLSNQRYLTVLNNGNFPGECYMSVGDITVYEQPFSIFRAATPPAWMATYPSERFWQIIWNTTRAQMPTAIDISRRRNAGYVYVTNDTLPNPYDSLPAYWTPELNKLSELCP
jgi:hypothetical protein